MANHPVVKLENRLTLDRDASATLQEDELPRAELREERAEALETIREGAARTDPEGHDRNLPAAPQRGSKPERRPLRTWFRSLASKLRHCASALFASSSTSVQCSSLVTRPGQRAV